DPADRVYSLGNPGEGGQLWVFRSGEVLEYTRQKIMAADRTGRGRDVTVDGQVILTDLPSRPGESGSPLLNQQGELAGVLFCGSTGGKDGGAVGVEEVRGLLRSKAFLAKVRPASPTAPPAVAPSPAVRAPAPR